MSIRTSTSGCARSPRTWTFGAARRMAVMLGDGAMSRTWADGRSVSHWLAYSQMRRSRSDAPHEGQR